MALRAGAGRAGALTFRAGAAAVFAARFGAACFFAGAVVLFAARFTARFGAAFFAGRGAAAAFRLAGAGAVARRLAFAVFFAARLAGFFFAGADAAALRAFLAGRLGGDFFAGDDLPGDAGRLPRALRTTLSVPGPGMIELSPPVCHRTVTIVPDAPMTTPSLGAPFDVNATRSPTSAIGQVLSLATPGVLPLGFGCCDRWSRRGF